MLVYVYYIGITQSKIEEYSKSEKKDRGTKQDRLKDGNPHKPVYTHKAQNNISKPSQPRSGLMNDKAQSNTDSQTMHNPHKSEEPTDTQTKDSQKSGNPASSDTSGITYPGYI